jgi:hypothetical protein
MFSEWWPVDLEGILIALNFTVAEIIDKFAHRFPKTTP